MLFCDEITKILYCLLLSCDSYDNISLDGGVMIMSETSDRLLAIIKEKDISYGELSKLTGIPKSVLQRYATGFTSKIPVDRLQLIARALNVDPYTIADFDDANDVFINRINTKKEDVIKNPPPGLEPEDMKIAFDYHDLDNRGKRAVKNVIESEKAALTDDRG